MALDDYLLNIKAYSELKKKLDSSCQGAWLVFQDGKKIAEAHGLKEFHEAVEQSAQEIPTYYIQFGENDRFRRVTDTLYFPALKRRVGEYFPHYYFLLEDDGRILALARDEEYFKEISAVTIKATHKIQYLGKGRYRRV